MICLALSGALAMTAEIAHAQIFRKKTKSRKDLLQENLKLKYALDSVIMELDAYKDTAYSDMGIADEKKPFSLIDGVSSETYSQELTDSLLDIWTLHQKSRECYTGNYDMDSVHFTSNVPDKVILERLEKMNSFITLPYNETVRNYILLYSEKMPEKMAKMLGLANYYFPIFEQILDKYGMPEELKYMAVIESALNPIAVSRAGAKGMWQFMYSTAKLYGLEINSYVDERLDPVKAADAAARYLADAYKVFGDWNLAISSYNCGAGNVNKAIRRGAGKDFWGVYDFLPRETRGYVPAFVGAMYAFTYYKEYGIIPEKIRMPAHVDTFHIHKMLHFQQIQDLTGISADELRNLNPQYIHDIIPGNNKDYILRLPLKYSGRFIDVEDSVYTHRYKELFNPATLQNIASSATGNRVVYRVKSGDYLGRIASRHHVTVAQLKKWNNLRNNNLRIGQVLVIYGKGAAPVTSQKSSAPATPQKPVSNSSDAEKAVTGGKAANTAKGAGNYEIYVVKAGDTLYSIAKNYPGITANDIMKFNGITSSIKPGMKLKIPKE